MNTHPSKLLLVFLVAILASCTKSSLSDKIGVCSGFSEWDLVAANGNAFIEANALSFLIPQEDDAAFEKYLAIAKKTASPIYSASVLFPGNIAIECRWEDWEKELPVAIAGLRRQIKSVVL